MDHCRAIDMVIDRGKTGEIYNISTREEGSNINIVKEILKLLNKSEEQIEFVSDRRGHDFRYALDNTNIGWKPVYNLKDGLNETIKWYVENEEWWNKLIH